ncbi:MAG: YihY/virulence factor BrkB family protein [Bacteroidales bacterium]|nr:YihY/virulence factor BrkB family protein [Bacteroidales bacterium]
MEPEHKKRTYRIFNKQVHQFGFYLKRISLPGFNGVPIYDVFSFFFKGLSKGSLNTRASSIAFNFLLALGPAVIFFLALIPYLPIKDFKGEMMEILNEIIPKDSYIAFESLLDELFMKRSGMPVFGFLVALFFAEKGISSLIEAFNATYHTIETRRWLQRQFVSVLLVFILFILVIMALSLLFFSKTGIRKLVDLHIIEVDFTYYLILIGRWIIITILTFLSISFLYYLAPARKSKWKFFSTGSTLATLLTIVASLGFTYFVNNFAQFNKFFGSISALVALMLWLNFNALTLLIGFELNASISNARIVYDNNVE